jgi:hypothetical protein
MKKLFLVMTLLVSLQWFCVPVNAQSTDDDYYEAFIAVNDNVNLTQLRDAGLVITARYDGIITAKVNKLMRPSAIKAFDGVEYATPALTMVTYSDSARYYSRVEDVVEGRGLDMPYTGEGVIVGVIDCGFDFNHINFCDSDGNTRVKAVYMPLDESGKKILIDRIQLPGSCFETPDKIKALTTDDPKTTHGTQTAGIAAGSYRDNGWYGVAPGADIVACAMPETELTDVRIAHCLSYINDYAKRMGKPYVVNISLGNNAGPHDGTSFLTRIFKQISGPGKVIVVSAGNDGDNRVVIHRTIKNNQDTVYALLNGYNGGLKRTGYLSASSKGGKPFNTRLIVVDTQIGNIVYKTRAVGATSAGVEYTFSSEYDEVLAQYYTGSVYIKGSIEANSNPTAQAEMNMTAKSGNYVLGFMYYSPQSTDLAIWTSQYAFFSSFGFPWAETGSALGSINDLATTDSVISVGSYNTKQFVPLRDGSTYYRPFSKPMELSYYSSYGPDENGIARPDVCAPGSVVISSANRYDVNAPNLQYWQPSAFVDGVEYPYCPDLGTSMSAPVVAGAVALWLQANPNLGAADIRDVLKQTSYKDKQVITGNSSRWGNGKLDVNAGMRYVLHIVDKNGDVNNDGEVNISDINLLIDIILGGNADELTLKRADVNDDDEINISDLNSIINTILN